MLLATSALLGARSLLHRALAFPGAFCLDAAGVRFVLGCVLQVSIAWRALRCPYRVLPILLEMFQGLGGEKTACPVHPATGAKQGIQRSIHVPQDTIALEVTSVTKAISWHLRNALRTLTANAPELRV